jgi:predicted ribosome quality control (RQC) complex YloA/Tae2 family protein
MSGQDKDKTNRQPDAYEYELPGGYQVLAGKTDAENDFLSIKFAAPNDYWFHVRGMPGSHVILSLGEKEEPAKDIIKQAAAVAAYHSKARSGGVVPVSCTRAKHVTKSRGDKPGTVHIRKEIVLKVRPAVPGKIE